MGWAASQRQAKFGFQIRDKRNVESDRDIRQGVKNKSRADRARDPVFGCH